MLVITAFGNDTTLYINISKIILVSICSQDVTPALGSGGGQFGRWWWQRRIWRRGVVAVLDLSFFSSLAFMSPSAPLLKPIRFVVTTDRSPPPLQMTSNSHPLKSVLFLPFLTASQQNHLPGSLSSSGLVELLALPSSTKSPI